MNRLKDLKLKESNLQTELVAVTNDLTLQKSEADEQRKIISAELARAKGKLKTAKKSLLANRNARIQEHEQVASDLSNDLIRIQEDLDTVQESVSIVQRKCDDISENIREQERYLQKMLTARSKVSGSLYSVLENEMKKYNIYIQAYHGGSLTGGDIIQLFKNADQIIRGIEAACCAAIERRIGDGTADDVPSISEMMKYLDEHRQLFSIQNSVYANLRIVHPSALEKKRTRVSIAAMKEQWSRMGFSETPKAHLIFYHAADDQEMWGGLGDKTEDALERIHQTQKAQDCMTMRMSGGHPAQLKRQSETTWRNDHPNIKDRILEVRRKTERKHTTQRKRIRDNRKRLQMTHQQTERFKRACINLRILPDGETDVSTYAEST